MWITFTVKRKINLVCIYVIAYICVIKVINNNKKLIKMATQNLESEIRNQIGENAKNGIFEVFVNHQDYFTYYGLGTSPSPNMNQKMYAVVWDNSVENLCLNERKAWAELKSIAEEEGVDLGL